MKFGLRKPSLTKMISARTTGAAKRSIKKAFNPLYGKKGTGWITNPKKAAYNMVYNKTTVDIHDLTKAPTTSKSKTSSEESILLYTASRWLEIAEDCVKIVNSTTEPRVFFDRYELLLENMQNLASVENDLSIQGTLPSVQLEHIKNIRFEETDEFIKRSYKKAEAKADSLKTDRGKQNAFQRYFDSFDPYVDKLSQENIQLLESLKRRIL